MRKTAQVHPRRPMLAISAAWVPLDFGGDGSNPVSWEVIRVNKDPETPRKGWASGKVRALRLEGLPAPEKAP